MNLVEILSRMIERGEGKRVLTDGGSDWTVEGLRAALLADPDWQDATKLGEWVSIYGSTGRVYVAMFGPDGYIMNPAYVEKSEDLWSL